MYCIFWPLIHILVIFYEKAIFMGEFSVGRMSAGELSVWRIVRLANCPWANFPRANCPWTNSPVTEKMISRVILHCLLFETLLTKICWELSDKMEFCWLSQEKNKFGNYLGASSVGYARPEQECVPELWQVDDDNPDSRARKGERLTGRRSCYIKIIYTKFNHWRTLKLAYHPLSLSLSLWIHDFPL